MAAFKTGTICQIRSSTDDWRVIGTQFDGLVNKYSVKSLVTGEVKTVFVFESLKKKVPQPIKS